jgi:hypothetical protein
VISSDFIPIACEREAVYAPRQAEESILYGVVAENLETFIARKEQRDRTVPRFAEREFRSFLDCGIPARGFLRIHCAFEWRTIQGWCKYAMDIGCHAKTDHQPFYSPGNTFRNLRHFLISRRSHGMKMDISFFIQSIHPVYREQVVVQVQIQGIAKSLNECHCAAFELFAIARFPAQKSEYRLNLVRFPSGG